jgi:hypothetical protein
MDMAGHTEKFARVGRSLEDLGSSILEGLNAYHLILMGMIMGEGQADLHMASSFRSTYL